MTKYRDGDFYINNANQDFYLRENGAWVRKGNIRDEGSTGLVGVAPIIGLGFTMQSPVQRIRYLTPDTIGLGFDQANTVDRIRLLVAAMRLGPTMTAAVERWLLLTANMNLGVMMDADVEVLAGGLVSINADIALGTTMTGEVVPLIRAIQADMDLGLSASAALTKYIKAAMAVGFSQSTTLTVAPPTQQMIVGMTASPFLSMYTPSGSRHDASSAAPVVSRSTQATSEYAIVLNTISTKINASLFDITGSTPVKVLDQVLSPPFDTVSSTTALDPTGQYLVLGNPSSPYFEVLDIANGLASLTGTGGLFENLKANGSQSVLSMDWGANGVLAVGLSASPWFQLFDMTTGGTPISIPATGFGGPMRAVKFSGDGNYLFATGTFLVLGGEADFAWWDTATWTLKTKPTSTVTGANCYQSGLSVNFDGTFIASGTQKTGEVLVTWTRSGNTVTKNSAPASAPTTSNALALTRITSDGTRLFHLGSAASGTSLFQYSIPGLSLQTAWTSQPFSAGSFAPTPDF